MQIQTVALKPLDSIPLNAEEATLLKWLRSVVWEETRGERNAILYKAKVPEFYGGTRLYRMQAGGTSAGSLGTLEIFIRKLSIQGIVAKQGLYPLTGHGSQARYLSLTKADLDNLGIGDADEDED